MKKRLSANDLYVEPRRSSIPALSLTEKTSERVERVISRSSSRRPSYSDSGNGSSLLSSAHFSTGFSTVDSGRSSSRRGSSLAIDQDAAKREGVISYTPQIRTAPVSGTISTLLVISVYSISADTSIIFCIIRASIYEYILSCRS